MLVKAYKGMDANMKCRGMQYAVCVQAGVYLPEEFMEDVMILDDVIGEQAQEETA